MPESDAETRAPERDPVVRGGRSLAGEIRARLEWIEAELRAGHSRAQIAEALRDVGITISAENLKKALYRARRERAEKTVEASTEGQVKAVAVPPPRAPQAPIRPQELVAAEARQTDTRPSDPPPEAANKRLTMEEAMDPKKRADFAARYFEPQPLVIKPKSKSES